MCMHHHLSASITYHSPSFIHCASPIIFNPSYIIQFHHCYHQHASIAIHHQTSGKIINHVPLPSFHHKHHQPSSVINVTTLPRTSLSIQHHYLIIVFTLNHITYVIIKYTLLSSSPIIRHKPSSFVIIIIINNILSSYPLIIQPHFWLTFIVRRPSSSIHRYHHPSSIFIFYPSFHLSAIISRPSSVIHHIASISIHRHHNPSNHPVSINFTIHRP